MSSILANVKEDLSEKRKGKVLNKDLDHDDEDNSILWLLTDKCCGIGIYTNWSFISINHHEIEDDMIAIEIVLQKAKLR